MFLTKDIKDIIKDNTVHFLKFRQGYFYYKIELPVWVMERVSHKDKPPAPTWYFFPVPQVDIGDATLEASDKAMFFMRYIRQAISTNTFLALQ